MKSLKILTLAVALLVVTGMSFGLTSKVSANNDGSIGVKVDSRLDSRGTDIKGDINIQGGMHEDDKRGNDDWSNGHDKDGKSIPMMRMDTWVGTVIAINGSTLTIKSMRDGNNFTVNASNATVWKGSNSELSKLAINDVVVVRGTVSGSAITASAIAAGAWKSSWPENGNWNNLKPGITGTVTGITGTSLTVKNNQGAMFAVETANAKLQKEKGTVITISDIKIGDTVFVQGTVSGNTVAATNVFDVQIYAEKAEEAYNPDISGKVTVLNGLTWTVVTDNNTSYTVDVSNAKLRTLRNGEVSSKYSVSNVKVGDTVWLKGSMSGTTFVATSLVDTDLTVKAMVDTKVGFFHRIGNWFRGWFGRK